MLARFAADHPQIALRVLGRNSSATADAVRAGEVEAGLVVLPVDDDGLAVRPVARDEVLYASADPANTAAPVTALALLERRLVLYEAQYAKQDPTRRQLAERVQASGGRIEPRVEVELADTALALAAAGIGDTYVPRVLARSPGFRPCFDRPVRPAAVRRVRDRQPARDAALGADAGADRARRAPHAPAARLDGGARPGARGLGAADRRPARPCAAARRRRDLDALVLADELERLVEREPPRRHEPHELVGVDERMFVSCFSLHGVHVEVLGRAFSPTIMPS